METNIMFNRRWWKQKMDLVIKNMFIKDLRRHLLTVILTILNQITCYIRANSIANVVKSKRHMVFKIVEKGNRANWTIVLTPFLFIISFPRSTKSVLLILLQGIVVHRCFLFLIFKEFFFFWLFGGVTKSLRSKVY